jgi:hypothetical protein
MGRRVAIHSQISDVPGNGHHHNSSLPDPGEMIPLFLLSASASQSLWADQGGLIGLVLGALFLLIGSLVAVNAKTSKNQQAFLSTVLSEARAERKEDRIASDKILAKLANALDGLAAEIHAQSESRRLDQVRFDPAPQSQTQATE